MLVRDVVRVAIIAVSATSLLMPSMAVGECVTPEQSIAQAVSSGVRVTVLLDGKAQGSAKIEGFASANDAQTQFTVFSGDDGVATLPTLSPGYHHIVATAKQGLRADLDLVVSSDREGASSAFSMDLRSSPYWGDGQLELAAAKNKEPSQRIRDFAGVLEDPSGAEIPGTKIAVWKRGTEDEAPAVEIVSDQHGRFSTHLTDGTYVAVFDQPGFRVEAVVFEVSRIDGQQELKVSMQIGSC
jgi:hypothetical protein